MMRRVLLIIFLALFSSLNYAECQDMTEAKENVSDNFSYYMMGIQSQLLGNFRSADYYLGKSIYRSDSSVYLPSLISSLNLHLENNDFGPQTEKMLKLAYENGVEEKELNMFMIQYTIGKKDFDAADSICRKILLKDPNNSEVYSLLAYVNFAKEDYDTALEKINFCEENFGINLSLFSIKTEILERKQLGDSLLSYTQRVYDQNPENLHVLSSLANAHTFVGNDSSALAIWKYIEQKDSSSIEFLASRNYFYFSHGMREDAVKTAAELLKSPYVSYEGKSQVFRQMMYASNPTVDTTMLPLLDSLLQDVYKYEVDTSSFVRNSALSYFYFRNRHDICFDIIDNLITSFPSDYSYIISKTSLIAKSNYPVAIQFLDSVFCSIEGPLDPDLKLSKASFINEYEGEKPAIKYLKKQLKCEEKDSVKSLYYSYIADLYNRVGNFRNSYVNYEKAIELNQNNLLALNNFAYHLAQNNIEINRAYEYSHKVNMMVPDNATYLDTEAYILYIMGDYKKAKAIMDTAFSVYDDEPSYEMLLHYADILRALNNYILAKDYYNRALKAGADKELITERLKSLNK